MPLKKQVETGWREEIYLPAVLKGIWVTSRHFGRNMWAHILGLFGVRVASYTVTTGYPETATSYPTRYRTLHRLVRHPDGSPRCTACMCCETACPADCIRITAGEYPDRRIEKYPETFEIDISRCIFCGYCVEACPEDAIRMDTGILDLAGFDRHDMVLDRDFLLSLEGREMPGGGGEDA
jgi:NADH-quinone oxidoreductase subunit I